MEYAYRIVLLSYTFFIVGIYVLVLVYNGTLGNKKSKL